MDDVDLNRAWIFVVFLAIFWEGYIVYQTYLEYLKLKDNIQEIKEMDDIRLRNSEKLLQEIETTIKELKQ